MKKTLVIIFSIVLCIAIASAAVALGGEGGIIKKEEQKTEETGTQSTEDKELKAEISKISDTNVDFRANKVQKFENENYALTYKEIDPLFTEKGEEKLIYTGKTTDGYDVSFKYNVKDGKIFVAKWNLPKTEKQATSISMSEAEGLARKYAAEYCDLNVYSLSYAKERTNEYAFVFTKFIDGYETEDQVDVKIDFHGNLIYLRNNTGVLDKFKIEHIDETKVLEALEAKIGKDMEYTIGNQRIVVEDGKVMMEYGVSPANSRGFICLIPIE